VEKKEKRPKHKSPKNWGGASSRPKAEKRKAMQEKSHDLSTEFRHPSTKRDLVAPEH